MTAPDYTSGGQMPGKTIWPSSRGYRALACAAAISLIAAEYLGPLVVIVVSSGLICVSLAIIIVEYQVVPHIPTLSYWLVGIFVIGLVSSIASNVHGAIIEPTNLQRDLAILISYSAFLMAGYVFARDGSCRRSGLTVIVLIATILSVIYIVRFAIVISGSVTDLYEYRLNAGRGSQTQCAGIFAAVLLIADRSMARFRSLMIGLVAFLTLVVFICLSRGLIIDVLILAAVIAGTTFGSSGFIMPDLARLLKFLVIAFVIFVALYYSLLWSLPGAFRFVSDVFGTKLVNSLTEVATNSLETRQQITLNYRAFELANVKKTFGGASNFAQWFGQGWGEALKFGLETASTKAHFTRTEASFLHNGYAYYLLKTGIIGVFLYACFLAHLAVRAISPKLWPLGPEFEMQRKILLTCAGALTINTFTTGGLGFPAAYLGLVLLTGICFSPPWWHREGAPEHESGALQQSASVRLTDLRRG